ncbi:peptide-methionine (R)-S-oxide reductase MsrB [soil metagenome]
MISTTRRTLIGAAIAAIGSAVLFDRFAGEPAEAAGKPAAADEIFPVTHTDEEWKRMLDPGAYQVLRHEGTERPYTSPLNDEHRTGLFACAGCALPLFSSKTKFDSRTGWPSFWQPLDKQAVIEHRDTTFGMVRTEVKCRQCGGHLGHVFDDGPKPTGLRYCMNGVAMTFKPASA